MSFYGVLQQKTLCAKSTFLSNIRKKRNKYHDFRAANSMDFYSSSSLKSPKFACRSLSFSFLIFRVRVVVGVLTQLLPRDGAWRKTMEPQKPGNSPGSGPEVVERQRIAKEWVAQRVRSWTVQNEIRGVLERVSADAAGKILDSANPKKIRA